MKRPLAIRKGGAVPFRVSAACWIDLLAYGHTISEAEFNPLHPKSKAALQRLRRFHRIVAAHSHRHFPTMTINDGAVAYRDLSWRSKSVTFDFLRRALTLFQCVNNAELSTKDAGVRLVLGVGFRVKGSRRGKDATTEHVRSVMSRLLAGELSSEEAIHIISAHRQCSDVVPALQANFAFTKAYLAESSGTSGGLPGACFYVDKALFSVPEPHWIELGPSIPWHNKRLGLAASFAQATRIDWTGREGSSAPSDIRDGLELAQVLAPNDDVLAALHAYRASRARSRRST